MKNSWIKTSERLPKLTRISDSWETSEKALICLTNGNVFTAIYDFYNDDLRWIAEDHIISCAKVAYWQPIEAPNPILEELRANQNYYLNT